MRDSSDGVVPPPTVKRRRASRASERVESSQFPSIDDLSEELCRVFVFRYKARPLFFPHSSSFFTPDTFPLLLVMVFAFFSLRRFLMRKEEEEEKNFVWHSADWRLSRHCGYLVTRAIGENQLMRARGCSLYSSLSLSLSLSPCCV